MRNWNRLRFNIFFLASLIWRIQLITNACKNCRRNFWKYISEIQLGSYLNVKCKRNPENCKKYQTQTEKWSSLFPGQNLFNTFYHSKNHLNKMSTVWQSRALCQLRIAILADTKFLSDFFWWESLKKLTRKKEWILHLTVKWNIWFKYFFSWI